MNKTELEGNEMEALKILTSMMKTQEEYDRDFDYAEIAYEELIARIGGSLPIGVGEEWERSLNALQEVSDAFSTYHALQ